MSFLSVLHPSSAKRTAALNDNDTSTKYNKTRNEFAEEESHETIKHITDDVAAIIKGTINLSVDLVTGGVSIVSNAGRYALDLLRIPPRMLLAAADLLAEKSFGLISRIANKTNKKIHSAMEGSVLKKLFERGHGSGHGGGHH